MFLLQKSKQMIANVSEVIEPQIMCWLFQNSFKYRYKCFAKLILSLSIASKQDPNWYLSCKGKFWMARVHEYLEGKKSHFAIN